MKLKLEELSELISDTMREQHTERGLSTARSEKAYRRGHPGKSRRKATRQLSKAQRRQGAREIRFGLEDLDGDGDIDLVNLGPSGHKAEVRDILVRAGILDDESFEAMAFDEYYEDPKLGKSRRHGGFRGFMTDLAWQIASGEEKRITPADEARLIELDPDWGSTLDTFDDEVMDQMRRNEFADEEDMRLSDDEARARFSESKENKMSNGFGRSDIKSWFAQTLYEDFETSKPRKRRGRGILTEATSDDRKTAEPGDLDKLKNVLVVGTLAAHGIEIDLEDEEAKALKTEFDNIIMAALEKYPDCVARLSDHIGAFVRDAQSKLDDYEGADGSEWDESDYGDLSFTAADRAELVDTIAGAVWDAISDGGWTGTLDGNELDDLVDNMVAMGDVDLDHWEQSNITPDEINDRVDEFKDDYQHGLTAGGLS